MLFNFNLPKAESPMGKKNSWFQINKPKKLLFIISLLVLSTVFGSCSTSRKAKKKCRECPEFSMGHSLEKPS